MNRSAARQQPVSIRSRGLLDDLLDDLADRIAQRLQPRSSSPRRLLTLRQVGEMIGRSPGAVGQLVRRGELRSVRSDRRIHVELSEVENWMDRCAH